MSSAARLIAIVVAGAGAIAGTLYWKAHRPQPIVSPLAASRPAPSALDGAIAAAEAVGGLDERFFMYTEDVDFCAALRRRGRRVLFTPHVEVVHLRGRSAATAPGPTREAYLRSHLAFYDKHHPAWAPILRLYRRFLS